MKKLKVGDRVKILASTDGMGEMHESTQFMVGESGVIKEIDSASMIGLPYHVVLETGRGSYFKASQLKPIGDEKPKEIQGFVVGEGNESDGNTAPFSFFATMGEAKDDFIKQSKDSQILRI